MCCKFRRGTVMEYRIKMIKFLLFIFNGVLLAQGKVLIFSSNISLPARALIPPVESLI